jgi:hypothetical protein
MQRGKIANHRFASAITPNANPPATTACARTKVLPFACRASALAMSVPTRPRVARTPAKSKAFQTPPNRSTRRTKQRLGVRSELCARFLPNQTQRRKKLDRFSIRMSGPASERASPRRIHSKGVLQAGQEASK